MGPQSYFPDDAPSVLPGPDEDDVVSSDSADEIDATDRAKEIAAEEDVDLTEIEGSGEDGRITADDVRDFAEADAPAPAADEQTS